MKGIRLGCTGRIFQARSYYDDASLLRKQIKLLQLIDAYKMEGHLCANVDPLGIYLNDMLRPPFRIGDIDSLRPETYGICSVKDKDKKYFVGDELDPALKSGFHSFDEIQNTLREVYCGNVGLQYMHVVKPDCKSWLDKYMLTAPSQSLSVEDREAILESILQATMFESFCGSRYSGAKRFSLEGCEALIPGLDALLQRSCSKGIVAVEMGMAHRGRLNVLHNIFKVPMEALLYRFQPYLPDDVEHPNNSDDVRYHLGMTTMREYMVDGYPKPIRISIAANPSHLEAVNSVVLGKTRARQFLLRGEHIIEDDSGRNNVIGNPRRGSVDYSPSDWAKKQAMAVLIHGDASFFQGTVRESLGFSGLRDYTTGGTVHIIINNQVGFTTTPKESHSSIYCSDVALTIGAPIFHVNGDDPDAVCQVMKAAVDYRQEFGRDCIVNLWGYRRHGHNEQDTPELTLPLMYSKIAQHPKLSDLYASSLPHMSTKNMQENIQRVCNIAMERVTKKNEDVIVPLWSELGLLYDRESKIHSKIHSQKVRSLIRRINTGVDVELLRSYGRAMFTLPNSESVPPFTPHGYVSDVYAQRLDSIQAGSTKKIKWATAEALAFGSLLGDGFHIRLSGQDVERGTFNQRHAVLYDQERHDGTNPAFYKPWTALQDQEWHQQDIIEDLHKRENEMDNTEDDLTIDDAEIFTSMIRTDSLSPMANRSVQNRKDQFYAGHYSFPSVADAKASEVRQNERVIQKVQEIQQESLSREKLVQDSRKALGWRSVGQGKNVIGEMEVCNSPLSEEAVLGFEHGYSLYSAKILAIWEAQFGDFSNCAQPCIDLFIASGEDRWVRSSGIVLLLPHGYDGQGPDHSTARVERFLQLCSEEDNPSPFPRDFDTESYKLAKVNMHVINPSTPAQYFHALRRQMLLPLRKPLVIFTPKYLLHHGACVSSLEEMKPKTKFKPIIDDIASKESHRYEKVRRVVICSGKLYYHLLHKRKAAQLEDEIALIRVEQFCPFPFYTMLRVLSPYLNHGKIDLIWAQEEPKNMGAWSYVEPRISWVLQNMTIAQFSRINNSSNFMRPLQYVGRPQAASPATGSFEYHREEMQRLVAAALGMN